MTVIDGGLTSTSWRPVAAAPVERAQSPAQPPAPAAPPASRPFEDPVTLTTRPPADPAPGAGPQSFAAQVTRASATGRGSASGGLSIDVVV